MITRAVLDGVKCVVLHVAFTPTRWNNLAASHFSELYLNLRSSVDEWVGRAVVKRLNLAVCVTGLKSEKTMANELRFFAGVPEFRSEARHPEWGEPGRPHYAVPLSMPVSRVVLFADEIGAVYEDDNEICC